MQAATVAANLRSYRYVLNDSMPSQTVVDVVAPDRCRGVYNQNGSMIESIHIGRYFYAQQPGTDQYIEYYNDRFDSVACPGDFMPDFLGDVSQLTEASIVGYEYLDGHKVVHIRYTLRPASGPFPTGSAGATGMESEVWIEKQTARLLKLVPSIYEPTAFFVYSRFDEPVMPPIEKPTKLAPATVTPPPPVPTSPPDFP